MRSNLSVQRLHCSLLGLLTGYVPSAIALVGTNTPEKHVGYALGIMATASAAGNIVGPSLAELGCAKRLRRKKLKRICKLQEKEAHSTVFDYR